MSSGVEIFLLAPMLIPYVAGSGVAVSGGSVVTTGAYAAGTTAAGGATGGALAAGTALAGGAVMVFGAAAAALIAAQHLQGAYDSALCTYNQRIDAEQAPILAAGRLQQDAMNAARLRVQKSRIQAAESADLAFLRGGLKQLQKRLQGWPDIDPDLPGACAQLLHAVEQPGADIAALFTQYESLGSRVAAAAERQRESLIKSGGASAGAALQQAVEAEVAALRADVAGAPPAILNGDVRAGLERALAQVESLVANQPQMASQGLQMLRSRVGRELSTGATREVELRAAQEAHAARLRELAGRVSARSQATLAALESEDLASSSLAIAKAGPLRTAALGHLQQLAKLLAGEFPAGFAPLEKLAREADALFVHTADELRQIALQIYLESQVTEVFTQLGYRVTTVGDPAQGTSALVAALGEGRGVEVRMDGTGYMHSELVALSPAAVDAEPHAQDKVCALMDDVFDALRARGCGVKEKKRRHFKLGRERLRVVDAKAAKTAVPVSAAASIARTVE